MRIEDREDYVDQVAQAVIDRIEERDRIAGLVEMVVQRVVELQRQQAMLTKEPQDNQPETKAEETHDDGK